MRTRWIACAALVWLGASTAFAQSSSSSGDTSAPAASSLALPSYASRIAARIRANVMLADPIPGNPVVDVEVHLAPDGTIVGRIVVKSSGSREWDDAVLNAVDRAARLPPDVDGRAPPLIVLHYSEH